MGASSGVQAEVPKLGRFHDKEQAVLDVVYIALTLAFFGLMLLYVRGCEHLGKDAAGEGERQ